MFVNIVVRILIYEFMHKRIPCPLNFFSERYKQYAYNYVTFTIAGPLKRIESNYE